jgi:hypothetical protein
MLMLGCTVYMWCCPLVDLANRCTDPCKLWRTELSCHHRTAAHHGAHCEHKKGLAAESQFASVSVPGESAYMQIVSSPSRSGFTFGNMGELIK